MKKILISAASLVGCFVLIGIAAQMDRKSYYESQLNSALEKQEEHEYQESAKEYSDFYSNSGGNEIILHEEEGQQDIEFKEEHPNSAPIPEADMGHETKHEYVKE